MWEEVVVLPTKCCGVTVVVATAVSAGFQSLKGLEGRSFANVERIISAL